MLYFCLHFLIYFFIVETSKATLKGIIKYYYNYTTNDSGKDYQSQGRSRTHTFRKDFFRVHVCKPETLFFFSNTNALHNVWQTGCAALVHCVLSFRFCKSKTCFVCTRACLCSRYSALTDYSDIMFCLHSYIRGFGAKNIVKYSSIVVFRLGAGAFTVVC